MLKSTCLKRCKLIVFIVVCLFSNSVLANNTDLENFEKLLKIVSSLEKKANALEEKFARLSGAVIAFEKKEAEKICPLEWELYEPAQGRFVIGAANSHLNKDMNGIQLSRYVSFADDPLRAIGGEEKHLLSELEMPAHNHKVSFGSENNQNDDKKMTPSTSALGGDRQGINSQFGLKKPDDQIFHSMLKNTGGVEAHNNMPPYVALYYCKKK